MQLSYCRAEDNRLFFLDVRLHKRAYGSITPNEINTLLAICCNEALPRGHHRRTSMYVQLLSRRVKWNEKAGREHPTAMERALRMMWYYTVPTNVFTLINGKRPTM